MKAQCTTAAHPAHHGLHRTGLTMQQPWMLGSSSVESLLLLLLLLLFAV
jgi:hypothetical protein